MIIGICNHWNVISKFMCKLRSVISTDLSPESGREGGRLGGLVKYRELTLVWFAKLEYRRGRNSPCSQDMQDPGGGEIEGVMTEGVTGGGLLSHPENQLPLSSCFPHFSLRACYQACDRTGQGPCPQCAES